MNKKTILSLITITFLTLYGGQAIAQSQSINSRNISIFDQPSTTENIQYKTELPPFKDNIPKYSEENEYLLKDYSNAAVTAGFYFSTDIDDAIGYSFDRNNKNYGYLYEITVNPDNFIHLDRNLELLDNSQVINAINHSFSNNTNFLIELLKSEQYLDVLWDFDDLSQYGDDISLMNYIEKTLLPDIANQYLERFTDKNGNINMLKILNMIGNDFYNGDTESINKKFIQITSKSGFLVDYNKDVNNLNFVTNEKHKFHFVFLDADEVNKRLKQVKQIDYKKNVSNNDVGYDLNSLPKKESNKRKLIKFKK